MSTVPIAEAWLRPSPVGQGFLDEFMIVCHRVGLDRTYQG